jgi:shikimate kinase
LQTALIKQTKKILQTFRDIPPDMIESEAIFQERKIASTGGGVCEDSKAREVGRESIQPPEAFVNVEVIAESTMKMRM